MSDHQDRMEKIMRYSVYLEETRKNLSITDQKLILFTSFLVNWQISYKHSQSPVQMATTKQIMILRTRRRSFLV